MTAAKTQDQQTAVVHSQPQSSAITPMPIQGMQDLMSVGDMLARSGMFGVTNPAAGMVVALTCHQTGQTIFDFLRTYHIINGKPSMKADSMAAEFRKRGGRYKIIDRTDEKAVADFTFEGNTTQFAFTIEEARQAGLVKDGGNWAKYPANMLWWRMMSNALRVLCPELVAGVYTPEEIESANDRHAPVPAGPDAALQVAAIVSPSPAQATESTPPKPAMPKPEPDFSKAGGVDAPPPPPVPQEEPTPDPQVCPIGSHAGKPWAAVPLVDLRKAAALPADQYPAITPAHRNVIAAVIAHKEGGAQ